MCLIDPSNDQLVKNEEAQIFYNIRSQTKPISIGANYEIPHNAALTTQTYDRALIPLVGPCALSILPWSNDQLVKDEGVQIFYNIRLQTKPNGIGVNCEIPHNFKTMLKWQSPEPLKSLLIVTL